VAVLPRTHRSEQTREWGCEGRRRVAKPEVMEGAAVEQCAVAPRRKRAGEEDTERAHARTRTWREQRGDRVRRKEGGSGGREREKRGEKNNEEGKVASNRG